ncbi:XRE family transcriptional regulator [Mycobacterium adipatum]|uniref:XRE family transcriptional regulator n=1 Tax=Mycobacterium adipatum TaxID=1682113 RepID=UPI0034E05EFB
MSLAAKPSPTEGQFNRPDDRPVEFWPTSAIRSALDNDDLDVWQRIVAAIKRDPFGRTARQVEEVLETEQPYGVSAALTEVLEKAREHLEANERAEVSRHVRQLLERSGLGAAEFASRIGVPGEELTGFLDAVTTPSATMMIRMRRLSDRFARIRAQRAANSG